MQNLCVQLYIVTEIIKPYSILTNYKNTNTKEKIQDQRKLLSKLKGKTTDLIRTNYINRRASQQPFGSCEVNRMLVYTACERTYVYIWEVLLCMIGVVLYSRSMVIVGCVCFGRMGVQYGPVVISFRLPRVLWSIRGETASVVVPYELCSVHS